MRKMLKIFNLFLLVTLLLSAGEYKPIQEIHIKGMAKDIELVGNHLLIGTDKGLLQVYDYTKKKMIEEIKVPDIKDFMGDTIPARVSSVDFIDGRYLLLNDSGKGGYSDLRIYENGKLKQILSAKDKKAVIRARFIDKNHILLAYLSNEVSLLDINTKKELYKEQLSESKFSDFALNANRSIGAFGCESGEVTVLEVKSGKILKRLNSQNVDNVFNVDIKKDFVSCAGQDRRASWYNWKSGEGGYFKAKFLVYATALSPSATRVAYAMNEDNSITIYNLLTKSKIAILRGQKSTLNRIIFKDENTLFSASNDDTVMMWSIK